MKALKDKDIKQAILDEAREIYIKDGLESLSMRKVAQKAGITPGAIYWHYPNKEALVAEIFIDGVKTFSEYMLRSLSGRTPAERLKICMEGFLQFALEEPKHFQVFFLKRPDIVGAEQWGEFDNQRLVAFRILMDRVRECMDDGIIKKGSVYEYSLLLLTTCQGLVTLYLMGQLGADETEFTARFYRNFELLMQSLKP
jgi:AcrR family transcriptional regulator